MDDVLFFFLFITNDQYSLTEPIRGDNSYIHTFPLHLFIIRVPIQEYTTTTITKNSIQFDVSSSFLIFSISFNIYRELLVIREMQTCPYGVSHTCMYTRVLPYCSALSVALSLFTESFSVRARE